MIFGRACPGREVAENTLWAFTMSLFYAFRILPADDSKPITVEYIEGSVR
jgi:hypothetical protein